MSIDEVAHQLNRALDIMPDAALTQAAASIDEAIADLHPLAADTDQLAEPMQQWQHASTEINRVRSLCVRAGELIEEYLTQIGASRRLPASKPPPPSNPPPPTGSPPAVGIDGSEYPAEAAADVVNLPSRVEPRTNQRTVGHATLNDQPIGELKSGNDAWSAAVSRRLQELGITLPRALHAHTEMKLAAMMLDTRATDGKVTINNVPCGSQPGQIRGCHQTLDDFLPKGYVLTVLGTTEQGKPFLYTYHGKARR